MTLPYLLTTSPGTVCLNLALVKSNHFLSLIRTSPDFFCCPFCFALLRATSTRICTQIFRWRWRYRCSSQWHFWRSQSATSDETPLMTHWTLLRLLGHSDRTQKSQSWMGWSTTASNTHQGPKLINWFQTGVVLVRQISNNCLAVVATMDYDLTHRYIWSGGKITPGVMVYDQVHQALLLLWFLSPQSRSSDGSAIPPTRLWLKGTCHHTYTTCLLSRW